MESYETEPSESNNEAVAVYQSVIYGNDQLLLQQTNEQKTKKPEIKQNHNFLAIENRHRFTVCGYIRNIESTMNLFSIIPNSILFVISEWYDKFCESPFIVDCKLEEFETLYILGIGSFGRANLVKDPQTNITYALKKIRKNKVIETGQQEHMMSERTVMGTLDSDFCCKLFGTYQDEFNIYFLMEPVLGGELFTVLRWNKKFSGKTARFYSACVVLAFEHLHSKNIIYRDLKPENLLISKNGYCKLADFLFAKKRNKSCTLCGTPEYLSPEVIQNYSQGFAVDWWALGVFIYEMVIGHAPFQDDPNVKMYEKILTYDVEFPPEPKLTPRGEHLICALLEKNSYQRLGAGTNGTKQILKHPWFYGLNWDEMRAQKIAPPYIPNIADEVDNSSVVATHDDYPAENIDEKLDPDLSAYEWCEDF